MKKIYCMIDDDKTRCLSEAGKKHGLELVAPKTRSVFFPFFLLRGILKGEAPDAIIVRYLNDSSSFFVTLILFTSRMSSFYMSLLFGVKVIWFCHNVDKETAENYPWFTAKMRNFLVKKSTKIYVMDKLLCSVAKQKFPSASHKIDYINFGVRENPYRRVAGGDETLIGIFQEIREKEAGECYIAFCPTNSGDKYLHIKYARDMVDAAREQGLCVYLVIVGQLRDYLNTNVSIRDELSSSAYIYCIQDFLDYDAKNVASYIDFYWRGLADQSISYSLYEAATHRLPTLALNVGFVGAAVESYKLGATIQVNMKDAKKAFSEIRGWDNKNADIFLSKNTWEGAVLKVLREVF